MGSWRIRDLAGRPGEWTAAEQVQVEMVHGLAAVGAGIDDDSVTFAELLRAGDLCRHP